MAKAFKAASRAKSTDKSRSEAEPLGGNRSLRTSPENPKHGLVWRSLISDAERLVNYAAVAGINVHGNMRQQVFNAKQAIADGKTVQNPTKFLTALTALSKKLKPVSAESLRQCIEGEAKRTLDQYKLWALLLACFIVAYSIYAFVASANCEAITKDIESANALAVTLSADIERSPDGLVGSDPQRIRNLQQFASTFRAIHTRALGFQESRVLAPFLGSDRSEIVEEASLELPPNLTELKYRNVVQDQIRIYQKVRENAKATQEQVSTSFGAITTGLLPLLYALLGATAYLIRAFDAQIKARTFLGGHFWVARLLTAGIAGMVVGLFSGFGSDHGVSLPPLALAFLVGYAVDPFFAFLDGLVKTLTKRGAQAS
jgi:hypothetical protein